MYPAQKALWYIESHLAEALTLDEIAGVAGVSRFHLVRAFAAATGILLLGIGGYVFLLRRIEPIPEPQ